MSLKKITIRNTRFEIDPNGQELLHVEEPHALIMAAGYLKFVMASKNGEGIYFRGQRKLYSSLTPTLFRSRTNRELTNPKTRSTRASSLNDVVKCFQSAGSIFNRFGEYAHEPLLQHYGINTTWIDVVDNVWVALWFACYRALSSGQSSEYLHFERRTPSNEEKYAYILLVAADITNRNRHKPGFFYGNNTELVDLRMAAPSVFLRPHAQHGLLLRKKGVSGSGRPLDYKDQVRGVIRVDLAKALKWLGDGKMVGIHSLFPPPYYDNGYQILLSYQLPHRRDIGNIAHVGA